MTVRLMSDCVLWCMKALAAAMLGARGRLASACGAEVVVAFEHDVPPPPSSTVLPARSSSVGPAARPLDAGMCGPSTVRPRHWRRASDDISPLHPASRTTVWLACHCHCEWCRAEPACPRGIGRIAVRMGPRGVWGGAGGWGMGGVRSAPTASLAAGEQLLRATPWHSRRATHIMVA